MTTLAQTRDVWTPYESHGKGKGHPVTPEPAFAGFALVGVALVVAVWRRARR